MTPAGRRLLRALSGPLVLLLLDGASVAADPVYVKLLQPPVAADSIGYPRAVEADLETGEVFVADTRRNRILIFDTDGAFAFEIDGGRALSAPTDLAVDRDGYLFVLANHQGRRALVQLDFDGLFLREIPVELPEDIEAPNLASITISPEGDRLYLIDRSNLVLWIVSREGELVRSVDLAEGLGEEKRRDMMLGNVDAYDDRLLVTVPSSKEIRIFDLDGTPLRTLGKGGTAYCSLGRPTAAALDREGNLIIIDQQRMLILRWRVSDNTCISEHYGIGSSPGYLYFPMDISLDTAGRAYVSQGFEGRVQMYSGFPPAKPLGERIGPERDESAATWAASQAALAEERRIAKERRSRTPEAVIAALESWAEARRRRSFDMYVGSYAIDFHSATGDRLDEWTKIERRKSQEDGWTDFAISEMTVELLDRDMARARFRVGSRSEEDGETAPMTLLLRLEETGWKIIEEWAGGP